MTYTKTYVDFTDQERSLLNEEICGPHCDPKILHAFGECEVCDEFPLAQKYREMWNINFTGHSDLEKLPCPAEVARGTECESWGGNKPKKEKK